MRKASPADGAQNLDKTKILPHKLFLICTYFEVPLEYEHFSIYDSLITHQKYFVVKSVYLRLVRKKMRHKIYLLHGRISI